ncbi:hypothetical protein [Commensalibacter nepenthis]|uniref:Uncharacterized protein n=1 Tax=Commensalibacter nepenthis TaxID=3043872 RepID=A0ABT6Q6H4_9PROT|nr:hypothetical protein [Commensalibacter sp. TBRC 10068]MDI2112493.1 hypothetical protein [Commensalibacter sp. TBRC 10068]
MALFFPEWIPWWLQLVIVGVVVIFGLCFLLMPFSVFGLKSRLTYLDHQMEDIQAQLRVLLKRIPDARERLEFKLQPVPMPEREAVREENTVRERKSTNSPEYYSAVPLTKSNPTCFDPPSQAESAPVGVASKTAVYHDAPDVVTDNRARTRPVEPVQERPPVPVRREERVYDPPPKSAREERQEESHQRRRAEPILRWPPR